MKFFNVILLKKNKTIKEKTFSTNDKNFNLQNLIDNKLVKKERKFYIVLLYTIITIILLG